MATHALRVLIDVPTRGLNRSLQNAGGGFKKLGLAAGVAGAAIGAGVVDQLHASVEAAKDAEASMVRVRKMVENAGISWKKHGERIDAVIQKHSRLTGLDDEELSESFANMVRTTKNVNEALRLNALAADISRTKGIQLAGAQSLLARVYNGSFTGLKRLGIAIAPVTRAQDRLRESSAKATSEQLKAAKRADDVATRQKAIAALQKSFGGQAEAYGRTAAGAQERFAVAVENLQEKLGSFLLPAIAKVTGGAATFVAGMESGTGAGGRFAASIGNAFARVKAAVETVTSGLRSFVEGFKNSETWAGALAGALGGLAISVAAVKLGLLVSGLTAAAGGFKALTIAMLTNPFVLAGAALAALGAGLVVAYQKSEAFRNAVTTAFNAVRSQVAPTIDWLRGAVPVAFEAVKTAAVTAFETVKTAIGTAVGFIRGWINQHRDDIAAFGAAWKNVATVVAGVVGALAVGLKFHFENVIVPAMRVVLDVVRAVWPSVKRVIEGALQAIGGIIDVFSGVLTGDFRRAWDGVKAIFDGSIKSILNLLRGLGTAAFTVVKGVGGKIKDGIVDGIKGLAGGIRDAIVSSVKWVASNVPALIGGLLKQLGGAIKSGISKAIGKIPIPFVGSGGDGIGMSALPQGGAFGGSLRGARAVMRPFAAIGAKHGLQVTPQGGLRPGAITSSGNPSWHGTGEALDLGGSPGGMLATFRELKSKFGGRLAELIYTPGGVGIKNGQPHRYTGKVASDHFDHVHVAFDSGKPGVGDGEGQVVNAFHRAVKTSRATPVEALALFEAGIVESGLRNLPYGDRDSVGALQQRPSQGWTGLMDPYKAALEFLRHARGKRPWRGTAGQLAQAIQRSAFPGKYDKVAGEARAYLAGYDDGAAAKGKGKSAAGSTPGASGTAPPWVSSTDSSLPEPEMYATTQRDPAREAAEAYAKGRAKGQPGPRKGGGPTKGFSSQEEAEAYAAARANAPEPAAGPTEFDFLDLELARAEATEDKADDLTALTRMAHYRLRQLWAAEATGDPRLIAQAQRDFTSADRAMKDLTAALDNTAKLAAELAGLRAEIKRQTDFAESVTATSNFQLTKNLADLISGYIVGRGVAGRAFTPGTGVEVSY